MLRSLEGPNPLQMSMATAMVHKLAGHRAPTPLVRRVLSTLRSQEDISRFLVEEDHHED